MSSITVQTLEKYLQQKARDVENYLEEWLLGIEAPLSLVNSIRYSLLGGGKRIRPILCLATVSMLKGDEERALPFASAIELIHTYSLIHDDLPCMDNDDYRRGKLTSHKAFGEAHAVLTGDGLLTEAFGIIAREGVAINPSIKLRIISEAVSFSGVGGMVGGQVMDMEADNCSSLLTPESVSRIHLHKTADLFMHAVRTGALLCCSPEETLNSLTQFAKYLGLAFQIQDDILDVTGDSSLTGKSTGSDIGKSTYPSLLGLEKSKQKLDELTAKAKEIVLNVNDGSPSILLDIADYLLGRKQ